MKRAIDRGTAQFKTRLEPGSRARFIGACLTFIIGVGLLTWDVSSVNAQSGARNNPRRTGFPQQKKGQQKPANDLTQEQQQPESGQPRTSQPQPSPEDR